MTSYHSLTTQQTLSHFTVNPAQGLPERRALELLQKTGPNLLPQEKKTSSFRLLLKQFQNPLVYILLIAALITTYLYEWGDTAVILIAILFNTLLGFFQEHKAQEAVFALKKFTQPRARVIRDGVKVEIDASKIAPGDILTFEMGDKVVADARLISQTELKIDESVLTGESTAVHKQTESLPAETILSDQTNLVFAGSNVVNGHGIGIVIATGEKTQIGQIAKHVAQLPEVQTPLQKEITRFGTYLSLGIIVLAGLVFVVGIALGNDLLMMFLFAVALAVSAIPEGLVIVVTIALAIGMQRMAKRLAIVRSVPAVEGLGAITVIAVDKTGTLTHNQLMVQKMYFDEELIEVTGQGYESVGEIKASQERKESPTLTHLIKVAVLCNNATLVYQPTEAQVLGDPVEGALLVLAKKLKVDIQKIKASNPRELEIPFSAEYLFMATVNKIGEQKRALLVKGAPKTVLDHCRELLLNGKKTRLDQVRRQKILQKARLMANEGLKPIILAYQELSEGLKLKDHDLGNNLTLIGLLGMADPLRIEAVEAVKAVQQAGVRVLMLTGDHRLTAASIAKKAGIQNAEQVLKGEDLEKLPENELKRLIKTTNVYARVTPLHKLKIVKLLQKEGQVVAMTGDGVNDAPALISADIGVAMGQGGTDVARSAADIILKDNNFTTIMAAIEEGRAIFDNLQKVILYLTSTNLGEVLTIVGGLVLGLPLPLYPTQILWLNLVTDGLPDNALIFEPKEKDILKRPPRDAKKFILGKTAFVRMVLFGITMALITLVIFVLSLHQGLDKARTMALVSMALFQIFNAFNLQSETESLFKIGFSRNWYLLAAVIISFFFQFAVVEIPVLQKLFRTVPLTSIEWLALTALATSAWWVEEIRKWIVKRA